MQTNFVRVLSSFISQHIWDSRARPLQAVFSSSPLRTAAIAACFLGLTWAQGWAAPRSSKTNKASKQRKQTEVPVSTSQEKRGWVARVDDMQPAKRGVPARALLVRRPPQRRQRPLQLIARPAKRVTGPKVTHKVRIRARIDGKSRVYIQGNRLWFYHLNFAAPGQHKGATGSTFINNKPWNPGWPYPGEVRNCLCPSSQYVLPFVLPRKKARVSIRAIKGRSAAVLIERPLAKNGFRFGMEWNDNIPAGSAWFEVEVTFSY